MWQVASVNPITRPMFMLICCSSPHGRIEVSQSQRKPLLGPLLDESAYTDAKVIKDAGFGLHRFLKPSVPYDFCIGVPISCLLSMG